MLVWQIFVVSCLFFDLAPGLRIKRADQATKGIDIYNLHITSDIRHRFATTLVTSRVENRDTEAHELEFYVQLPNEAFIANYTMEINGEVKVGEVKEKEKADTEYEAARERGHTAARVAAKPRETNSFSLSVNVAAQSKATFNLTYIEFLVRKLGRYEHVININPGQIVHDLRVTVNINETKKITHLRVPQLRKDFGSSYLDSKEANDLALIYRPDDYTAEITFEPTAEEQTDFSSSGIVGQLAIQYDVARSLDGGEIEVIDGYFVHYFAPKGLEPLNKDVVFVLDTSGSMMGRKMEQVRTSMDVILKDLREEDRFNMIDFDSDVNALWKDALVPVNNETVSKALAFASRLDANGGTNINDAVLEAISLLHRLSSEKDRVPIIIFLTDGEPSSGVTNIQKILKNVRTKNEKRMSIYSLGFGRDLDFDFLKKVSLQSGAVARKIYEDSDAALQLEGFYNEVATPLLTNVTFTYLGEQVDISSLTRSTFPTFYDGCEFAVAGRIRPGSDITPFDISPEVIAISGEGRKIFSDVRPLPCWGACHPRPPVPATAEPEVVASDIGFTERLWAYLTVKDLLRQKDAASNKNVTEDLMEKALRMSLRYNFVTPLTSMVVVQDDETKTSVLEEEEQSGNPESARASGRRAYGPPPRSGAMSSYASLHYPPRVGASHSLGARVFSSAPASYPSAPVWISGTSTARGLSRPMAYPGRPGRGGRRPSGTLGYDSRATGKRRVGARARKVTTVAKDQKRPQSGTKRKRRTSLLSAVTSDPHVMVKVGKVAVCFDLEGNSGDKFLLFQDRVMGLNLSGTLTKPSGGSNQTFFTTMTLKFKGMEITITAEENQPLEVSTKGHNPVASKSFKLKKKTKQTIVTFKNGLRVRVKMSKSHAVGQKQHVFLAIFLETQRRYVQSCPPTRFDGLLGQFACRSGRVTTIGKTSHLTVADKLGFTKVVPVNRSVRYNSGTHHRDQCWHVANSGLGLMKKHALTSFRA